MYCSICVCLCVYLYNAYECACACMMCGSVCVMCMNEGVLCARARCWLCVVSHTTGVRVMWKHTYISRVISREKRSNHKSTICLLMLCLPLSLHHSFFPSLPPPISLHLSLSLCATLSIPHPLSLSPSL